MKCPLLCTQGGGHFTIYGVPFFVDSIKAGLLAATALFRVEECSDGRAFDIHDETSRSMNMKDEISENEWLGERGESSDDQLLSILTGGAHLPKKVIGSSESHSAESMRYRCRGSLCSNSSESTDLEERVYERWKE
ncbi:MAG: hypothetical protein GWP41_04020 [Planctomycetia bacterium]|nr:hypothetical protein [Planctomycetia bacterium]